MAEPGPFDRILQTTPGDRRDRGPLIVIGIILGLALLLLILVLPPFSLLNGGSSSLTNSINSGGAPRAASDSLSSTARSSMPDLPSGYEAVSSLYDLKSPSSGDSTITIKLKAKQTVAGNLAVYSYSKGQWKRISDAELTADGTAAQADVPYVPENVAVLRRTELSQTVLGFVPAGKQVDPKVGGVVNIVSPLNYLVTASGDVVAGTLALQPSDAYRLIPSVIASDPSQLEEVLRSPDARDAQVQKLTALARDQGFNGFNLDYREISNVQQDDFVKLAQALSQALHQDGRQLVLTMPLPVKEGGNWNTYGFDWKKLAPLADLTVVRPDDDQSNYLKQTQEGLDYVTGQVDRSKVLLAITTASREKGSEGMRTLPLVDALGLAAVPQLRKDGPIAPGESVTLAGQNLLREEGASGISWDDQALAVSFTYPGAGGKRTVWLANQFSVAFRVDIARSFRLAGVALEDVSGGPDGIWDAVRSYAEAGDVSLVRPNDQMMAPSWSVSGGQLDTSAREVVVWKAPDEPGDYEAVLSVGDGLVRVGQKLPLQVSPASQPPGQ